LDRVLALDHVRAASRRLVLVLVGHAAIAGVAEEVRDERLALEGRRAELRHARAVERILDLAAVEDPRVLDLELEPLVAVLADLRRSALRLLLGRHEARDRLEAPVDLGEVLVADVGELSADAGPRLHALDVVAAEAAEAPDGLLAEVEHAVLLGAELGLLGLDRRAGED